MDIAAATVPTHDTPLRMCGQPPLSALRFSVGKQIPNFVGLQIHENTAEAFAATPAPVVHPDDIYLAHWHRTGTRKSDHSRLASEIGIPSLSARPSPPLPQVANPISCTDVRKRLVRREETS